MLVTSLFLWVPSLSCLRNVKLIQISHVSDNSYMVNTVFNIFKS